MEQITVRVVDDELWKKFHPMTEMILTKKGRSLFPKLEYRVSGLNPESCYAFQLRLERVDNIKYKFDQGEWREASTGEPRTLEVGVRHPDGFRKGSDWMRGNLSFGRLKITNNLAETSPNFIILQSMHKYIPVLTIINAGSSIDQVYNMPVMSQQSPYLIQQEYRFDFTSFIAVTAYQNHEVTRLKVLHNKYARGFRSGEHSRKRVFTPSFDEENDDTENQKPMKMPWAGGNYIYPPIMNSSMMPSPLTPPEEGLNLNRGMSNSPQEVNVQPEQCQEPAAQPLQPIYEQNLQVQHQQQNQQQASFGFNNYYDAYQYYPAYNPHFPTFAYPHANYYNNFMNMNQMMAPPPAQHHSGTSVDISPNSSYNSP